MAAEVRDGSIEIDSREVWGQDSPDQRQAEHGSQGRLSGDGGQLWAVPERVSREAGPWTSIAFFAIGGILGQLIQDLEYQLAYQQSSIDWYKAEIKKNEEALVWHEDKLGDVERRLATLRAHAESLRQSLEE